MPHHQPLQSVRASAYPDADFRSFISRIVEASGACYSVVDEQLDHRTINVRTQFQIISGVHVGGNRLSVQKQYSSLGAPFDRDQILSLRTAILPEERT